MDGDKNINQNQVPEPPQAEIDIRTMETDLKAFQEGGGELPGSGIKSNFSFQKEDSGENQNPSINVSGYSGPEKPIFSPSGAVSGSQGGPTKVIAMTVLILIIIVGLGLLGYYVVFPLLFT